MMYVLRSTLLTVLLLSQTVSAVKMDETTHDQIIQRLEMGLDGMDKTEPERTGILLRLGDLYADRARLKAINEMDQGCQKCKGALTDRQKAISLYQEALPKVEKADQGRRVLQIAHLYGLNNQNEKAAALYNKILNARRGSYSSEVRAIAYTSVGESKFRVNDFKGALKAFENARKENLKTRALVEFRIAWCLLNLGQTEKATATLVHLLKTPEILVTQTTDGKNVDPTFVNDLSHDLAVFLARGKVGPAQIDLLRGLSPDAARKGNLYVLGTETDRLGNKTASLIVWAAYVDEGQVQPMEKLEVQARVAQIFYDMNKQDQAANAYEKALDLWRKLGCTDAKTCEPLKIRLKKFVTGWNKAQKKKPTANLFRVYVAYTQTFPTDTEMLHWGAVVAQSLGKYKEAGDLFHRAALQAYQDLKSTPDKKEIKNIFEGSLLAEIEMAEARKDVKAQEVAYDNYLKMNPNGAKAFQVRYQRAHLYYQTDRHQQAFSEFHYLASMPGKDGRDLKVKSADLALDSLVAMKDDKSLQVRSLEYARLFPERKVEYLKISRKATLNLVAANLQNEKNADRTDYKASLATLNAVNMDGADDAEKIKFYKNKVIIAQKAMDLGSVKTSADKLLNIKSLSADDREWTMAQQVWVAELELNFAAAYRITREMKLKELSKADRELRLALLTELAGDNPRKHNENYLKLAGSSRSANLIRVTMVKDASSPWRELDRQLKYLKQTPDLLAGLTLEVFATRPNYNKAERMLRTTGIGRYAAGQTLQRQLDLRDFQKFDRKIRAHRIYGYNEHATQKTLKERLQLLNQSDRGAQAAFRRHDWTMQILSLGQLARENRRLYHDIQSLPVPRRLNAADKRKYQELLQSQSAPYLARAEKIESELNKMWSQSNSVQNLQTAYMTASPELQKLYRSEIGPLAQNAPSGAKNRLQNLLNTPFRRPSQKDILVARRELQASPFDISKAERLRELESQSGRPAMVVYLDERISQLKKGKSL
jgi:tetratricopeptide (TPR) repeat protein